jgi:hypothetical protein
LKPFGMILGLAALMALKLRGMGEAGLGNWALGGAMALQFIGYQHFLSPQQPQGLLRGLEWSQAGWFLFSLSLGGKAPLLGCAGFLILQLTVKAPLSLLLKERGFGRPWLTLFSFFALVGCLPFASFAAYFQAFVPLMSVGEGVGTMQQKLFSGAGLWAALVLLSVVYQSCALGYVYWSKLMREPREAAGSYAWQEWLSLAGLLASLALGLSRNWRAAVMGFFSGMQW